MGISIQMRKIYRVRAILFAGIALTWPAIIMAHAMPANSEPGVGAVVATAPQSIQITFDARLEEMSCTITVKNSDGQTINSRTRLEPANHKILETDLNDLLPGDYHVYWNVVSVDGHRTNGDYVFHFRPQ